MEVQERAGVKVYSLCTGKPLPTWLGERARRNLSKRDEGIRRRIDLIQDFQFSSSSQTIRQSPDGRFIAATGTYAPTLKMYELSEMGMKFERRLDSEAVDFLFLSQDYGKLAILQADRNVELHAPYGKHFKTRIPTFGRAMAYETSTCQLHITSSSGDVYRINLEEGRFSEPLSSSPSSSSASSSPSGTTCIATSPTHRILSVGSEDGSLNFYDTRISSSSTLTPFSTLNVSASTSGYGFATNPDPTVTSVAYEDTGVMLAAGTGTGCVALYDVRSSKPVYVKEHNHGLPIHTCAFHQASGSVLSSDEKIVKGWRYKGTGAFEGGVFGDGLDSDDDDGPPFSAANKLASKDIGSSVCTIEAAGSFNHFIISGDSTSASSKPGKAFDSGLILCAGEQSRCQAYYVPSLGVAPRWCSFLDNITEELEERGLSSEVNAASNAEAYEDYKFLTREEVTSLGIDNLVGTPLLRGYMHGFFIDSGLYAKVKSVANPFEFEEYRKKKIKERIEQKRASRIAPKEAEGVGKGVNKDFADRLLDKSSKGKKAGKTAEDLLKDSRFGSLFDNPDFAIDEEAEDFKLRNPSGVGTKSKRDEEDMDSDRDDDDDEEGGEGGGGDKSGVTSIQGWGDEDEGYSSGGGSSSDESSESENEDGFRGAKVRGENYEAMKEMERTLRAEKERRKKKVSAPKKVEKVRPVKKKLEEKFGAAEEADIDIGSRLKGMEEEAKNKRVKRKFDAQGAVREFTYTPKRKQEEGGDKKERRKSRSAKSLK